MFHHRSGIVKMCNASSFGKKVLGPEKLTRSHMTYPIWDINWNALSRQQTRSFTTNFFVIVFSVSNTFKINNNDLEHSLLYFNFHLR